MNRLRFRLFGLEKTQRQLIEGLEKTGVKGAALLEVGCGSGHLHQALLLAGAASATGIDLSRGMLDIARAEAQAKGLGERVDYRLGDFARIADDIPLADVTILDKVVCCYPYWEDLVDKSLGKTRRVFGITYPRDRATTRIAVRLMRWSLNLMACCYRPYLHDPKQIEARIRGHGFSILYITRTTNWVTQVYTRSGA